MEEAKAIPCACKNFRAMHSDKDGTFSMDEIRAYGKSREENAQQRGREQFKKADKDHYGTLTRKEAKAMPHLCQNFDAIDADKDATVALEEIHSYMQAKSEQKSTSSRSDSWNN
jgi:Ca2+-binding EF-hand superfamily protein